MLFKFLTRQFFPIPSPVRSFSYMSDVVRFPHGNKMSKLRPEAFTWDSAITTESWLGEEFCKDLSKNKCVGEGSRERKRALNDAYGTWPNLDERTRTNQFCVRLPLTPSFPTLFHPLDTVLCLCNNWKFLPEPCTCCWTPRGKRSYINDAVACHNF